MLNLQQKQSLQQKLSPQQIQYIKLLQLPTLELEQRIKEEMEMNPVLEEGEEEDEEILTDPDAPASQTEEAEERAERDDEEFDWDEFLNSPDDLYGYKARVDHSAEEEQREIPMPYRSSMAEHIRDQVGMLDLSESDEVVAEQIIGSIDEDGYLRRPIDSIVDDLMFSRGMMITEDDVERILLRIQRLDPVGIASRDLRECLLVQLEVLPPDTPGRDHAISMLRDAYKAFTMKHFEALMRKLDLEEHELKEAFELIQRLDPKPGEGAIATQTNYITPDFLVEEVDGEFIISLNGKNAPELRVNRHYRRMWNQLAGEKRRGPSVNGDGDDTRQFLKNRLESARWFINSINQRRATMLKVMTAIVELQENFFREGEGHLRPMILKDVAERIGMDISTISRVVNGKYVQTEWGVYELKYFFSEGLTTESGEEVSNKEVKAFIERIISDEDKSKPLSDQRIAAMLEDKGIEIARRTVTKYREQLGVPVARLRKQIVLS
jgi:RNA polymerase sigma-54 factor